MRTAGIREARQELTSLLDDVSKGREVVITDHGRPVARLVPVKARAPFPDLRKVRAKARTGQARLSEALLQDREDQP